MPIIFLNAVWNSLPPSVVKAGHRIGPMKGEGMPQLK
jgi:hypothetical protein